MFTQHVHTRIDSGCPLPEFYKRIRIKRKDLAISVEGLFNNILNNGKRMRTLYKIIFEQRYFCYSLLCLLSV